jgi:hypothetical protein
MLLEGTMQRYEDDYLEIFEDNRRLMDFLVEIDSPIPGPLRVAADVTLTRRVLRITGAVRSGELGLPEAERELYGATAMARRLGAHLHLAPVRREVGGAVVRLLEEFLSGRAAAERAAELTRVLDLARQLGLDLDQWDVQNRVWGWAGAGRVTLDRTVVSELARSLWFDEKTLLARAGFEA